MKSKIIIITLLVASCSSSKYCSFKTDPDKEIYRGEDEIEEINAVQERGSLFNLKIGDLTEMIDSLAHFHFGDSSISYKTSYHYKLTWDSTGTIIEFYDWQSPSLFGNSIEQLFKSIQPLNPPVFLESYKSFGTYESKANIYVVFKNYKSVIKIYYDKAVLPEQVFKEP